MYNAPSELREYSPPMTIRISNFLHLVIYHVELKPEALDIQPCNISSCPVQAEMSFLFFITYFITVIYTNPKW